jgi:SAM-dependent methyltransferase
VAFLAADAYGRFMGRYSEPLAEQFVDWAGVQPGHRVLDVGAGPGALTARLVERVGAANVRALDPSLPFVAALRERCPGIEVLQGPAEAIPVADDAVDAALAQLVVHFMTDPVAGLREMARVTVPGGVVAVSVWDVSGGRAPMSDFLRAVRGRSAGAPEERGQQGTREGELAEIATAAGLQVVGSGELTVAVHCDTFGEWWEPYTLGVGPAGDHVAGLDDAGREALREQCRKVLPTAPFDISATAWCARGHA